MEALISSDVENCSLNIWWSPKELGGGCAYQDLKTMTLINISQNLQVMFNVRWVSGHEEFKSLWKARDLNHPIKNRKQPINGFRFLMEWFMYWLRLQSFVHLYVSKLHWTQWVLCLPVLRTLCLLEGGILFAIWLLGKHNRNRRNYGKMLQVPFNKWLTDCAFSHCTLIAWGDQLGRLCYSWHSCQL